MPDTTTRYGPLIIKNPVVIAAAGTSASLDLIKKAADQGAAAVVMKTLFEEEYSRSNPTPCYALINRRGGPMCSTTFYSFEQASPWGLERYAEEVYRAAKAVDIPVIASINCVSNRAWIEYSVCLAEAGAAALELNRSCPYSTIMLDGADSWTSLAVETLKLVKGAVPIPVCVKLTPQLTNPLLTAVTLEEAGAEGLVMFSRFTGLEIDLKTEKPIMHGGFAGHGGPWALHYALRWIADTSPRVGVPVSAGGGVCCGDDMVKFILAGASSVQLCTAIYMEGFAVIGRYLSRLANFMEQKGYDTINNFRGTVCDKIIPGNKVDRRKRAFAVVDESFCVKCGICSTVCLHRAVRKEECGAVIDRAACAGCGLCVELCPESAIIMAGL